MNILSEQIRGTHGKQVNKFAAELDRRNEELQFLEEMIYNVNDEMYTYQEEMDNPQQQADDEEEEESPMSKVVGKLFGNKDDGKKELAQLELDVKNLIGSLREHKKYLVAQRIELEKYIAQLQKKVQRASVDYGWQDFASFLSTTLAENSEIPEEGTSFHVFTGSVVSAQDIKPGMHLYKKRTGYTHHGICVLGSKGPYIIHFNGNMQTGGAWLKAKLLRTRKPKKSTKPRSSSSSSPPKPLHTSDTSAQQPSEHPPALNHANTDTQLNYSQYNTSQNSQNQSSLQPYTPIQQFLLPDHSRQVSPYVSPYVSPQVSPRDYPSYPPPNHLPQAYSQHQLPPGYPPQDYPQSQTYPQQNYPPQNYPLQNYPPQSYPPQPYPPQTYPSQAYPPQTTSPYQYPVQNSPHGSYTPPQDLYLSQNPPHSYTQQREVYPPQQYPPPNNVQNPQSYPPPPQEPHQQQYIQFQHFQHTYQVQQLQITEPQQTHDPSYDHTSNHNHSSEPHTTQVVVTQETTTTTTTTTTVPVSDADSKAVLGSGSSIGYVMKSTIKDFVAGGDVYVANYKYGATPDIIQFRARRVMLQGGYDFMARNCEHLATWCVTGVGKSLQVQQKLVEKMAKVAEFIEKAVSKDPTIPRDRLMRVVGAMPTPVLNMVLSFSYNQVEKFGKPVQFM